MVNEQLRRREGAALQRAATLELFYDLVFVFSITQISHLLLDELTWAGAGRAVIVLLAVWWSWNYTTWATNELNSETNPVRLLLIVLMLGSLLMAIALPHAFEERGLLFAAAYVAIQLLRHGFLTFVAARRGSVERQQAGRIMTWFLLAGVFWIAGGLTDPSVRMWWWTVALCVDYLAPILLYPIPGRPRLMPTTWHIATTHFSERFGLFVIAALGETVILTGVTATSHDLNPATVAALIIAFISTAAMWWLYFLTTSKIGEHALRGDDTRTRRARDVYTYGHILVIAGIILSAVGDELVIAHPLHPLATAERVAVTAGPILFLLAQLLIEVRATGRATPARPVAILACAAVAVLGASLPGLTISTIMAGILVLVAIADDRTARRPHTR